MTEFNFHPNSAWKKKPSTRPNPPIIPDKIEGVCWHIINGGRLKDVKGEVRLRSIQKQHMGGRLRWSDIAYAYGLDYRGMAFEAQNYGSTGFAEGFSVRDGEKIRHNGSWVSAIFLSGTYNDITPEVKNGIKSLTDFILLDLWKRGCKDTLQVRGHCEVKYRERYGDLKSCPGLKVRAALDELYPGRLEGVGKADIVVGETKVPHPTEWWGKYNEFDLAVAEGITDGSRPNDAATRAEVAIMMGRMLEKINA